ncbi:MAG: hypothetical protein PF503_06350 [Desulfobacula sp.]|jgi:hypothetical protein|nr:hypothetical protein [Desulfobacula sp.]
MTYTKNIGFQEMVEFSQVATPAQQQEMDSIVAREDWVAFKKLVKSVLKTNLQ